MDLQPGQFSNGQKLGYYHGTRAEGLDVGSTLRPHNKLPGNTPNYADFRQHSRNRVFMASGEEAAWSWSTDGDINPEGRNWVAKVTPGKGLRDGPAENTADSAKIVERIDTMPGRQGTLGLNWNQFGKDPRNSISGSYNHPTDKDIELGHRTDPYSGHRPMTDGPAPMSLENLPEPKVKKSDGTKQGVLF